MAAQIRAKLRDILLDVRGRLMEVTGLPPERVAVDARQDADEPDLNLQADQYFLIRVKGQTPAPGVEGGGRVNTRVKRRIQVCLRTRLALDEAGRDLLWLTEQSLGHLEREHQLYDALSTYQPTDGKGNWLVAEPIVLEQSTEPRKDKADPSWGRSAVEFVVDFALALDQSYQ